MLYILHGTKKHLIEIHASTSFPAHELTTPLAVQSTSWLIRELSSNHSHDTRTNMNMQKAHLSNFIKH